MVLEASLMSSATAWRSLNDSLHIFDASITGIFSKSVEILDWKLKVCPLCSLTVLAPVSGWEIVVVWDIILLPVSTSVKMKS